MTDRPRLPAIAVALAFVLPACGGDGDTAGTTGPTGPTVTAAVTTTQAQADEAMGGLCDLASGSVTEMADAHEAFHGRAHEALHAIAARVQEVDPTVAAALLEAKAMVEADLEEATVPSDLPDHAQALVDTFGRALVAAGLQAPDCAA